MKVLVEPGKCQGYGNCSVAAPEVFDVDEEGFVELLVDDPPEKLREQVWYAIDNCPVRALALKD